jgi:argininosuccinate synthase
VVIGFERGLPVSLDGRRLDPLELVLAVHDLAGEHGVGRIDMIENRLVGIKSREVYEVPAALALITAHRDLEDLTLERDLGHFKQSIEGRYAELVYYGLWFSPLKAALDAFIDATQEAVEGEVKLRLHQGSATPVGRRSPRALYSPALATYTSGEDAFAHEAAAGFIKLWSLPVKVWAERESRGR